MKSFTIEFPGTEFPPVELPANADLPSVLTDENSPIQFGCRTGVCATCLVEVEAIDGTLAEPQEEEQETLEIYAPDNACARLVCQLALTANVKIKKIDPL